MISGEEEKKEEVEREKGGKKQLQQSVKKKKECQKAQGCQKKRIFLLKKPLVVNARRALKLKKKRKGKNALMMEY
jgi:hypothetical protein